MIELLLLLVSAFYAHDLDALGAQSFYQREAAQRRLQTPLAWPALERRRRETKDPEVRLRCGQALRTLERRFKPATDAAEMAASLRMALWAVYGPADTAWGWSNAEVEQAWPGVRLLGQTLKVSWAWDCEMPSIAQVRGMTWGLRFYRWGYYSGECEGEGQNPEGYGF